MGRFNDELFYYHLTQQQCGRIYGKYLEIGVLAAVVHGADILDFELRRRNTEDTLELDASFEEALDTAIDHERHAIDQLLWHRGKRQAKQAN